MSPALLQPAAAAVIYRGGLPLLTLLLLLAGAPSRAEEQTLPLPRWSEHELRAFRDSPAAHKDPADLLLPSNGGPVSSIDDLLHTPLAAGPRLGQVFNNKSESGLSPSLRVEDMRLFLPESILGLPEQSQLRTGQLPTPLAALRDVSVEFLAACAQSLPAEYLIDPDQLVPEIENHDLTRLLEFHAHDARIRLYVLVIGADQKLPHGANLDKIASGSLVKSDACLLVYPLGEPWRTRLFVSGTIHDAVSTDFLSETIQACLRESLQTSNVHDQLRRYTIHLSTRLFWLQKALGSGARSQSGRMSQPLAEFSPQEKEPAAHEAKAAPSHLAWGAAGVLLAGLFILAIRKLLHHRRLGRQRRIWMLSEPETVPRLGGAFTGGGGCMIRYS